MFLVVTHQVRRCIRKSETYTVLKQERERKKRVVGAMLWARLLSAPWLLVGLLVLDCVYLPARSETSGKPTKVRELGNGQEHEQATKMSQKRKNKDNSVISGRENAGGQATVKSEKNSTENGTKKHSQTVTLGKLSVESGKQAELRKKEPSVQLEKVENDGKGKNKSTEAEVFKTKLSDTEVEKDKRTAQMERAKSGENQGLANENQENITESKGEADWEEEGHVEEELEDTENNYEEPVVVVDAMSACDNATLYSVHVDFTSNVVENGKNPGKRGGGGAPRQAKKNIVIFV